MKRIFVAIALLCPILASAQLADSAKRLVRMEGAINFRDIGGYQTTDGREVKWGTIFRSADVSKLTSNDLQTLEQKHIHTVIDFRGKKEAAAAPDHILPNTDYTLCPAGSDSLPNMKEIAAKLKQDSFLTAFYSSTQYFGDRYRPMFQKLLNLPEGQSIMYHCTGGRDRTGMATALILYVLGVPNDVIEADFVASNVYLAPMQSKMYESLATASQMDVEQVTKAMALRPDLLHTMFQAITAKYGSVDSFLQKELGVGEKEKQLLRKKYTI
jgi:protein-tyrosine phosphatase